MKATGTPSANGTAFINALAGITDNSATTPYLIQVEPGIYDLGANGVTMKPYVDVRGSGPGVTTLTAAIHPGTATILDDPNATLSEMTIKSVGSSTQVANPLNASGSAPAIVHDVSLVASNSGSGQAWALYGRVVLDRAMLTATAPSGTAVGAVVPGVDAVIRDSAISASGGVGDPSSNTSAVGVDVASSGTIDLERSTVAVTGAQGYVQGVRLNGSSGSGLVRDSQVAVSGTGSATMLIGLDTFGAGLTVERSDIENQVAASAKGYGVTLQGPTTVTVAQSRVGSSGAGALYSLYADVTTGRSVLVGGSELDGGITGATSVLRCVSSWKADFSPTTSGCA